MRHEIKLSENSLEHFSNRWAFEDRIIGILKARILGKEVIEPFVSVKCGT